MKKRVAFILTCTLLVGLAFAATSIGVISIPAEAVLPIIQAKLTGSAVPPQWEIYSMTLWQLRLPRVILSIFAGGALALGGAAFQTIFRNPICDPYILGISSGASLGAGIAIIIGIDIYLFGTTLGALLMALLTLFFILTLAKTGKQKTIETLLLAGVALNFLLSALLTMMMVLHQEAMEEIIFWTMGSFATAGWIENLILFVMLSIVTFVLLFYSKDLNIMQLGDDISKTSGVNTERVTYIVLIFSSILVAIVVAFCGVIGFVGLVIPHLVRILFGNKNQSVFVFSLIFGAFFCLLADLIARTVAAPAELPVGSITALIGAPYFLYLLIVKRYKSII